MPVDATDRTLIEALKRDGRATFTQLGQRCGLTAAQTKNRISRLQVEGYIRGFNLRLNSQLMGLHASTYVAVLVEGARLEDVTEQVQQMREVEHIAVVSGAYELMLLVRARSTTELRRVVLEKIQKFAGVIATKTSVICEEVHADSSFRLRD